MSKILLTASAGGHWIQLMRIIPAIEDENNNLYYLSTFKEKPTELKENTYFSVTDASMWNKFKLFILFFQIFFIILKIRPKVVISTGAAPGFFAIIIGKFFGAKTIWIDSIANVEEMSLAGRKVKFWADHWLTQWKHLETPKGPKFKGSVL